MKEEVNEQTTPELKELDMKYIKEGYVTPHTAKLMQRLGFNVTCKLCYVGHVLVDREAAEIERWENIVPAPTIGVAQKWLIKEKERNVIPRQGASKKAEERGWKEAWYVEYYNYSGDEIINDGFDGYNEWLYKTYNEALEAGIHDWCYILWKHNEDDESTDREIPTSTTGI